MNIALWIVQLLLAAVFVASGAAKLTTPNQQPLFLFIGTCEVAGALGLVLPMLTRFWPVLTTWAAIGLATIMVLAAGFHISKAQYSHLPLVTILFLLAAFVVWGRGFRYPSFA